MCKLCRLKWIIVTIVAGLIISGYTYNTIRHKDIVYSEVYEPDEQEVKDSRVAGSKFLIITWDEEAVAVDELAELLKADIYKPQITAGYTRTYEDIDFSAYSTYFINMCGESTGSIRILEQLVDEDYLDGKTIIPIYDSSGTWTEAVNELGNMTSGAVWLTGGKLDKSASRRDIESWLKGLGISLVSEAEFVDLKN